MKSFSRSLCAAVVLVAFAAFPASAGTDSLETAGDIVRIAIPVAAAGMTWAFKDLEGAKQLGLSLVATAAATEVLKLTVDEEGPNGKDHAFPSGHASIAFAGAAFLQRRYGWEYGAPAYLAASFVGISRVATDEHRIHDVLAGAAIGILANVIFTTRREPPAVAPVVGPRFIGVGLVKRF